MKKYIETLKTYIEQHPPCFGDGESVLTMLYECHNENSPYDNEQIKADFNELYQQMNGITSFFFFIACSSFIRLPITV